MQNALGRYTCIGLCVIGIAGCGAVTGAAEGQGTPTGMPIFQVDPAWPALPNNWVLGIVSGVAVDGRDHVWILHRPRTVAPELQARAAPPVLEFDANGRFVNAWGGPGPGYDWPATEHGITIDHHDVVWIGGSAVGDDMLLNFRLDGTFLRQYGKAGQSRGNADTVNVNRPADMFVDARTDEVYVADGYGNRRIIVFDASTGAFKRMWGAFGRPPDSDPPAGSGRGAPAGGSGVRGPGAPAAPATPALDTEGDGAATFGNPVHGVAVSHDNLVYVADRANRRIQVFTPAGQYVSQGFINRGGPAAVSVADLALSSDPEQRFLYASDYGNSHLVVLDRRSLAVLYQFGMRGAAPGDVQGPHLIATDSKGNLYVAEVAPGNRAQKFLFRGLSPTPPPNALTADQLAR